MSRCKRKSSKSWVDHHPLPFLSKEVNDTKTRRYSITRNDADLITAALDIIIVELEKHTSELTVRELNQLSASRALRQKLTNYQWEI